MDEVWITLIVLFGLMFLGMPVAFAIAVAAILGITLSGIPPLVIPQRMVAGINAYAMLAVPMFLLMGGIMTEGKLTQRLIDFLNSAMGRFRGGLGSVNISTSMVNGGMSGSALADTAMVGSVLITAMRRSGYPAGYAAAITGASSVVGPIIPPSIPFIVYGSVFGISIGQLFLAGVVPGLLIGCALLAANYSYCRLHGVGETRPFSVPELSQNAWRAFFVLLTPVIILGGIFGGIFTPTEAAAVGVLYSLVLGLLVHRSLRLVRFWHVLAETAIASAGLFFIIAASSAYGWYLARSEVGLVVVALFDPIIHNEYLVLLAINVILLLFGMFMETYAILFLLVPLMLPMVRMLGVDPVQFGVMVVLNLNIGLVTPPFGMCMFIANQIAGTSIGEFSRGVTWFLPILLLMLGLVTFVPALSLWLPGMVGG
jgi:C4-dicarboxylate transporter, DctM subunit